MSDTNQASEDRLEAELENLIRNNIHTFADEYLELDECVAALTAYTNKQIEEVLDRLETHYWLNDDIDTLMCPEVEAFVEAERNKLKGAEL